MDAYEVEATAEYVLGRGFTRVALQFPDELLADAVEVSSALSTLCGASVHFFVMADTTYGSCCADEVAAAHVNAQCIIHYGHCCLSPVSSLPVRFVFGRRPIDVEAAADVLAEEISGCSKSSVVLYDLAYAYAIPELRKAVQHRERGSGNGLTFADVVGNELAPQCELGKSSGTECQCVISGLKWNAGTQCLSECKLIWIGEEGAALTSLMLTYSTSTLVRYDPETKLIINMSSSTKALQRRYYMVERAKDANIVGIVVGTLGVAGYYEAIEKIKHAVKHAGKKSYTLVMGKPNPAKLANFQECDVFVLVACPWTAFLNSKDYAVPVITPFEAHLAFVRGAEWTGSYSLDLQGLDFRPVNDPEDEEAQFSFFKGGYVETAFHQEVGENAALTSRKDHSLSSRAGKQSEPLLSAADFFSRRHFQGLKLEADQEAFGQVQLGLKGRAAAYSKESKVGW